MPRRTFPPCNTRHDTTDILYTPDQMNHRLLADSCILIPRRRRLTLQGSTFVHDSADSLLGLTSSTDSCTIFSSAAIQEGYLLN